MEEKIECILKKLHDSSSNTPRLEIYGFGRSNSAAFVGAFKIGYVSYILSTDHTISGGSDEFYDYEYVQFQKSELERLTENALNSKFQEASIFCKGLYTVRDERISDYTGESTGLKETTSTIPLLLYMKIIEDNPVFSICHEKEEILNLIMRNGEVKFLEDRLTLFYRCVENEYKREIFYDNIPNLPLEPEKEPYDWGSRIFIFGPKMGIPILFFHGWRNKYETFFSYFYQKRKVAPEEVFHGPYLAKKSVRGELI